MIREGCGEKGVLRWVAGSLHTTLEGITYTENMLYRGIVADKDLPCGDRGGNNKNRRQALCEKCCVKYGLMW